MSQMIGTRCHAKPGTPPSSDQEAHLPEYPLSLQTVGLLEEVDAGHHDGGDGALPVVDDPLQRHTELLAGHPAGHGEVGGGDTLGHSALFLVIVSHWGGYWQGVDIHVLL